MLRAAAAVVSVLLLHGTVPLPAQSHCDVHYRWQEKIDTTQFATTPIHTTISSMFGWASPAFTAAAMYWCEPRNTREQKVYEVIAWARRLKVQKGAKADGDWHIELTGSKTSSVSKNCIVVEIPPDSLSNTYFNARQDFLALVGDAGSTIKSNGDVSPPVRMKINGLAFFDGEHRGKGNKKPNQHGRCNSRTSALWEIHPVYAVSTP